ncbi:MAG: transaldolase, partial [Anaerolineae bacterium]|nr:transaldolase [Anaerolineae bacterium]
MIGRQLQGDAEEMLEDLYQQTLARIEGKRQLLATGFAKRQRLVLGVYQEKVEAAMKRHRESETMARLARRDHTLWKPSAEHERLIVERLGWLDLPASDRIDRDPLRAAREDSKAAGWRHVVLMGMGGSVLAAQALAEVFGPQPGYPQLLVLNSTDPAAVARIEATVDLARTLFVVASKTGKTLETLALARYFYGKARERFGETAGEHFVAITDPGSEQESEAKALAFRRIFLNPPDMNGRYAALSYLGLAPAALVGVDVEGVLDAGREMQQACSPNVAEGNNPGLWLGTVLAVLAAQGRDKLTLITSPEITPLASWIEQLVAASTGKEGKGIVPVIGETLGTPFQYDDDRVIIYLRLDGSADDLDEGIRRLQQAGHPVVSIELRDRRDVGAEFYRWMFATAIAGALMQINPFEEPNVAEGKEATGRLVELFAAPESPPLPDETPVLIEEDVALYADASLDSLLEQLQGEHDYQTTPLSGKLAAFLSLARSGDYVCLLAYVPPHPEIVAALEGIRARIRHILKRAVTLGYGPRSLHSSSQLHRGGPNTGVFILFTANNDFDLAIPGMPFGFRALKRAEAIGDLEAMRARGRRIVRVDLGADVESGLRKVTAALEAAAEKRG